MTLLKYTFIFFAFLLIPSKYGHPQAEPVVEKSMIIESLHGREYYLHFVKTGETLFAIARAYGVAVDDVFRTNPESRKGIAEGTVLKIPVKGEPSKPTVGNFPTADPFFYHIVAKQETLYGISKKYGVTIDAVKAMNPQMGDYPHEGETLRIPYLDAGDQPRGENGKKTTLDHKIIRGETLYGITRTYNVTIGEIKNANPGLTDALSIGATIKIPNQEIAGDEPDSKSENNEGDFIMHEVAAGETLYGIAREYAISTDSLRKYNPGVSTSISPGQELIIPVSHNERGFIVHKPQKKERLDGISQKYEVDLNELEELNPDIGKKAKKGQVVKIPVEIYQPEQEPAVPENIAGTDDPADPCRNEDMYSGNTFNVALLLPLFLESIDSIRFDKEKDVDQLLNVTSFRFAGFYAGFKMAVDSMINAGMKLNLFVYDVDIEPAKTDRALLSSELGSMDLIVGPFYLNSFKKVADFAKAYQIPIVNPLSKREEIIFNNPYVFKLKPSEAKKIDLLVDYLAKEHRASNIIVLRHNKYKYQSEVSYIRNSLNTSRPSFTYLSNREINKVLGERTNRKPLLTENKMLEPAIIAERLSDSTRFSNLVKEVIYSGDSITGLTINLSQVRPNVVVAISDDVVFSKEVMSQLNKLSPHHDITLFGLPSWNDFHDLETSHLLNLKVHTFSPEVINYQSPQVNSWIKKFRKLYHTDPSPGNYAFDGFDAGWYFLNALSKYGRDLGSCLPYFYVPLLQTRFNFEQTPGNGYHNIHWNLGKYDNYYYRKIHFRKE